MIGIFIHTICIYSIKTATIVGYSPISQQIGFEFITHTHTHTPLIKNGPRFLNYSYTVYWTFPKSFFSAAVVRNVMTSAASALSLSSHESFLP